MNQSSKEFFAIGALALLGVGGWFLANTKLEALRAELAGAAGETKSSAAVRPRSGPEPSRGASATGKGEVTKSSAAFATGKGEETKALAASATRTDSPEVAETLLTPEEVRAATLRTLMDLFERRQLVVSGGIMAMSNRVGASGTAFSVGVDGKLNPRFGELFGLSGEEVARLEQASTSLAQQVDAAILENTKIEAAGPNSYKIDTAAVPLADALRAQFIDTFRTVMGDDRYRMFAVLSGERDVKADTEARAAAMGLPMPTIDYSKQPQTGPGGFFKSFGNEPGTLTITKTADGKYSVATRSATSAGTMSGGTLDRYKAQFGQVMNLLPADF